LVNTESQMIQKKDWS